MARYLFGGGASEWIFDAITTIGGDQNIPQTQGGVVVTFFNDETTGTQYTDLLDFASQSPITSVTSSDGTDGRDVGQVPPFWGPDGVTSMWAEAAGGPRVRIEAAVGGQVASLQADVDTLDGQLQAHAAALNPHNTGLANLTDVTVGTAGSRTDGQVVGWDGASQAFKMLTPAQVSGAVLLNPPTSGGSYVGNVASPPDPAQGSSGNPWLRMNVPYSAGDNNPDAIQLFSADSGGQMIKTGWFNGNGEGRFAPSTPNRIAFRVFEAYENRGGPSTSRVFEVSTNPTNSANREPLLGAYGTGHSTQPGWIVATRVLAGQLGVRAGGSYNSLTAVNFRGQKSTTGAPTTGTWAAGDVVLDSAGAVYLCTASGTPGTWITAVSSAPTTFQNIVPATGMSLGTKAGATRLDRGGEVARMRGTLTATASVASGALLGTVAFASHCPKATVQTIARSTGGGNKLTVNTDGTITYSASFTAGQELWLDGITWDLLT